MFFNMQKYIHSENLFSTLYVEIKYKRYKRWSSPKADLETNFLYSEKRSFENVSFENVSFAQ